MFNFKQFRVELRGDRGRTAGPSTSLGMTRWALVCSLAICLGEGFKPQIPPLRFAPVGMTNLLSPNGRPRFGGADRDRTGDPLLAKQVLSQLSYSPLNLNGGPGEIRTTDLTLIRGAL